MVRIRDVVMDSSHPAAQARFWAEALDGYEVAPYTDEDLADLRLQGIDDPEDDPSVMVIPVARTSGPRLFFNLVPEEKSVKNRVHLDVQADDLDADVEQFKQLGATVWQFVDDFVVMRDPEGNEFCVMPPEG